MEVEKTYQTTNNQDLETYLGYCFFWNKNICMNRVERPGLTYCKKHAKFEGTDQKHTDEKTPAKEKKQMVLPKAAKPKPEEPSAPKVCNCVRERGETIILCESCIFKLWKYMECR